MGQPGKGHETEYRSAAHTIQPLRKARGTLIGALLLFYK